MSIRKRSWNTKGEFKSAWIVDYKDNAGKRRQETFKRKKDAERFWQNTSAELARGSHVHESESISIAEAGELWVASAKAENLERSTYEEYARVLRLHIVPRIGNIKLSNLTEVMVEACKDRLLTELPILTAHRVFSYLKIIIKNAESKGYVSKNVAAKPKITISGRHKKRVEIFSKDEINAALSASHRLGPKHAAFAHLFFLTGCRASEGRGLPWQAVDLENGRVSYYQRADRWGVIGPPKSESSIRIVPLTPSCIAALKKWKEECNPCPLDLVFPAASGKPLLYFQFISQLYDPIMFEAGLTKVVNGKTKHRRSPHAMRHTTASIWIEMGFSAKRIQVLMGHSSIQVTFDLYGHLIDLRHSDADMMRQVDFWILSERDPSVYPNELGICYAQTTLDKQDQFTLFES